MRAKKLAGWAMVAMAGVLGIIFSPGVQAMEVDFHGYIESNLILRDTNGFQYGFDNLYAVQQRNTLKFDVDAYPRWQFGDFSLDKAHLTYRGAVDTIFNIRDEEYKNIRTNRGPSRFDLSRDDIRYENDLREAFVDLVYQGSGGSGFFRPGRQMVSWGEVSGVTILDVINPPDNSFQMFFLNPDDLKIPLWMGRLNYSIPPQPGFNMNFDLLFIPDIRPQQFAPLDASMKAPYAFIFKSLQGLKVEEQVPTDEREYGGKVVSFR